MVEVGEAVPKPLASLEQGICVRRRDASTCDKEGL